MTHRITIVVIGLSAAALLSGCAATPLGPTVQVMPAPNKPFEVFRADQATCKQYAQEQVGGQSEAANSTAVGSTLLGALLGAGLGGAIGGGGGAGIGAAGGGVLGTAVGAGGSGNTQGSIQEQYNNAYMQCMYAKGNQVPGTQTGVYAPPPPPPPPYHAPPKSGGQG